MTYQLAHAALLLACMLALPALRAALNRHHNTHGKHITVRGLLSSSLLGALNTAGSRIMLDSSSQPADEPLQVHALLLQHYSAIFQLQSCGGVHDIIGSSTPGSAPAAAAPGGHAATPAATITIKPLCLMRATAGSAGAKDGSAMPQPQGQGAHGALPGGARWVLVRRYEWNESALVAAGQLAAAAAVWPGEALAYVAHVDALQSFLEGPPRAAPGRCDAMVVLTTPDAAPHVCAAALTHGSHLGCSATKQTTTTATGHMDPHAMLASWASNCSSDALALPLHSPSGSGWPAVAASGPGSTAAPAGCLHAFSREGAQKLLTPYNVRPPNPGQQEKPWRAMCPSDREPTGSLYPISSLPFGAKMQALAVQGILHIPRKASLPALRLQGGLYGHLMHACADLPRSILPSPPAGAASAAVAPEPAARAVGPSPDPPTAPEQRQGLQGGTQMTPQSAFDTRSNVTASRRCYLLFTCAGDRGVWQQWLGSGSGGGPGARTYDVIVAYYGSARGLAAAQAAGADLVYRARGSKFQNLYRLHHAHPWLLARYDAVAVWDDDLRGVTVHQINGMFDTVVREGLWLAQPSMAKGSHADHVITHHNRSLELAYTNFVEVMAPLFSGAALVRMLDSPLFTGELVAYGIDYLAMHILSANQTDKYGIMHTVQVFNPPHKRNGDHEIAALLSDDGNKALWLCYLQKYRRLEPSLAQNPEPRVYAVRRSNATDGGRWRHYAHLPSGIAAAAAAAAAVAATAWGLMVAAGLQPRMVTARLRR